VREESDIYINSDAEISKINVSSSPRYMSPVSNITCSNRFSLLADENDDISEPDPQPELEPDNCDDSNEPEPEPESGPTPVEPVPAVPEPTKPRPPFLNKDSPQQKSPEDWIVCDSLFGKYWCRMGEPLGSLKCSGVHVHRPNEMTKNGEWYIIRCQCQSF
jgi:hypothetical protein